MPCSNDMFIINSAVPSGSGVFQMPTCPSSSAASAAAASTLRGGGGQSQNLFSNVFSFLASSFFGMTLTTYHKTDLVEFLKVEGFNLCFFFAL